MGLLLKTTGGLIATAFFMGFKKLTEYKSLFANLKVKLTRLYSIKLDILKNKAEFLADFSVLNPSEMDLNIQTIGLVTLKRVLFYDQNNKLIAEAQTNISDLNINANDSVLLEKIPFTTKLTGGITRLQNFLKDKDSSDLKVVLELQALNKIYQTTLK